MFNDNQKLREHREILVLKKDSMPRNRQERASLIIICEIKLPVKHQTAHSDFVKSEQHSTVLLLLFSAISYGPEQNRLCCAQIQGCPLASPLISIAVHIIILQVMNSDVFIKTMSLISGVSTYCRSLK